ncbi:hypothetical protein [Type-D symbiont of Plautia stali]|uniref:hypothetical protein n=1 Tax=Type-D symbiont of Plautia stali TaxID=1560356 RepID=UPI000A786E4B|nr:hypothetical protein [Type-D symbiont of Plautia stali]
MNTATLAFESARVLDGYARLRFLPALFGDDFMRAETNLYLFADRFLAHYDGGVWDFALLPSGGGIVITSLVLNHRSWMYDHHDEGELVRCTAAATVSLPTTLFPTRKPLRFLPRWAD